MNLDKTWVAIGLKVFGNFVIGAEHFNGLVVKASEPNRIWGLRSDTLWRVGAGLGGGVQGVIMFFFEVDDPQNETIGNGGFDPAIDISVGVQWASFFRSLSNRANREMRMHIARAFLKIKESGITPDVLGDMIRIVDQVKNAPELARTLAGKGIIAFDIPGIGWSRNISVTVYSSQSRLDRYSLQSISTNSNPYYARGFVDTLCSTTHDITLMTENDRRQYIEGIRHCDRLGTAWRDRNGRTLLAHVLHYYFPDNSAYHTETRSAYIPREELVQRMVRFMNRFPNCAIESGYYV
jgi:hypothetical protein